MTVVMKAKFGEYGEYALSLMPQDYGKGAEAYVADWLVSGVCGLSSCCVQGFGLKVLAMGLRVASTYHRGQEFEIIV